MTAPLLVMGFAQPVTSPVATLVPITAVGRALRELVGTTQRSAAERVDAAAGPRTWAVLGDMATSPELSENERVVEHDRIGRLGVRLAVDKILAVGESRSVRALHQGAVMEGSWGDEARLVDADAAVEVLLADHTWMPRPGDSVLLAAPGLPVDRIVAAWVARFGDAVVTRSVTEEV